MLVGYNARHIDYHMELLIPAYLVGQVTVHMGSFLGFSCTWLIVSIDCSPFTLTLAIVSTFGLKTIVSL